MSDRLARRLAASALAVALVALALGIFAVVRADQELRAIRQALERALAHQYAPSLGPPPALDEDAL